jgi:type 2 lantibiotic biosynthesis protein LanM
MGERTSFLANLSARARFLSERITTASSEPSVGADPERAELWRLAAAAGDRERFERRLTWSGWDPARVGAALSEPRVEPDAPLPAWTELVDAWIRELERDRPPARRDGELPFAELYAPLVDEARARVAAEAPAAWARLSPAAQRSLAAALTRRLDYLCRRCVYVAYRRHGGGVQAFLGWTRSGGLRTLLDEYPVLARFAATATALWIEASVELAKRLHTDWGAIEASFGGPLFEVVEVAAQLSDPHAGGRSVAILRFDTGLRVVYKPRSLAIDLAFGQLVDHLDTCDDGLPQLRTLATIDRGTHGWVEFAERGPCPDAAAARRLYTRAGMLACLVYALGGLDCHHENLVACGEHFVFIDLETMLQPPARALSGSEHDADARVIRRFSDSVLRSGMFPCWEVLSHGDVPVDQSGLGGGRSQQGLAPAMRWRATGPDEVVLELHVPEPGFELGANVPTLDGRALAPGDYVEEIAAGFAGMYRRILTETPCLLAAGGPLARFAELELRYLLRPTRVYHLLLRDALRPPLLRDGVDFSIALEPLARALSKLDERPSAWTLFDAELRALERLDIPLFLARADARSIHAPAGDTAEDTLPASAREHLAARVRGLSAADLAEQLMIIRCSLHEGAMNTSPACGARGCAAPHRAELEAGEPARPEQLIAEAIALAEDIAAHAVRGEGGDAAWMGVSFMRDSQRFQLRPLNHSFDRGSMGVAIFLAGLARVASERREFAELAAAALAPVRRIAAELDPQHTAGLGLGAFSGLGGLIYGLCCCAELLGDPTLLDDARALAAAIDDELIAADRELDVVNGAAGAILGLLALHEADGDPAALERARACARHLLAQRERDEAGRLVWRVRSHAAQTGLSHGAAGFALALGRLWARTGDPELLAATREALAFEREAFVAEEGNWRDLRPDAPQVCAMSWCNGAPGIGLARTGLLGLLDDELLGEEIELARRSTLAAPLAAVDTLCCGNFGRIELLLRAGAVPEARRIAAQLVGRARAGGYRILRDAPPGMFAPGFMCGTAGIGYQLLRLAAPEQLPSVSIWETPVGIAPLSR